MSQNRSYRKIFFILLVALIVFITSESWAILRRHINIDLDNHSTQANIRLTPVATITPCPDLPCDGNNGGDTPTPTPTATPTPEITITPPPEPVVLDVQIDSDNNNNLNSPDGNQTEAAVEDQEPGKLLIIDNADTDYDGNPDMFDYGTNEVSPNTINHGAGRKFVPIKIKITGDPGPGATLRIIYDYRDPSDTRYVFPDPQHRIPGHWEFGDGNGGNLRLWKRNGDEMRDLRRLSSGGDYIAPTNTPQVEPYAVSDILGASSGEVTLYVEAVALPRSSHYQPITVVLSCDEGKCINDLSITQDSVLVTPVMITVSDLHNTLEWNPVDSTGDSGQYGAGDLRFPDSYDFPRIFPGPGAVVGSEVGGAITDGTSICLVSVYPQLTDRNMFPNLGLRIYSNDGSSSQPIPEELNVFGGLFPIWGNIPEVPPIPLRYGSNQPSADGYFTRYELGEKQVAFYVPPRNFLVPNGHKAELYGATLQVAQTDEMAKIEFQLVRNGSSEDSIPLGGKVFHLRRPPIVLVHGLFGNGREYWDKDLWSEDSAHFATRIYRVDYQETHALGYDRNFSKVPEKIAEAMSDYRDAFDNIGNPYDFKHLVERGFKGVKFAATKADVIGHSMGGQITRMYLSNLHNSYTRRIITDPFDPSHTQIDDQDWGSFGIRRNTTPGQEDPNWYIRQDNFGAGDIRRFIPIGSPFKGAPLGNAAFRVLAPNETNISHLNNRWTEAVDMGFGPGLESLFRSLFRFQDSNGRWVSYRAPTAIPDLAISSAAQILLENAFYPNDERKKVPWFPIVGLGQFENGEPLEESFSFIFRLVECSVNHPMLPWKRSLLSSNRFEEWLGYSKRGDRVVNGFSQRNAPIDWHGIIREVGTMADEAHGYLMPLIMQGPPVYPEGSRYENLVGTQQTNDLFMNGDYSICGSRNYNAGKVFRRTVHTSTRSDPNMQCRGPMVAVQSQTGSSQIVEYIKLLLSGSDWEGDTGPTDGPDGREEFLFDGLGAGN